MNEAEALTTLELLGSGQQGLVTAAQARSAGVGHMRLSRFAERGVVQRLRHGVYALPSSPGGPLQGLRAAWLSTDSLPAGGKPTAVVSGQSAAAVHGLGDLVPTVYEFTTPVRRQTTQDDIHYRRRDLGEQEVTWVDGLPVTTVARTVTDLVSGGIDQDHLAAVVDDAIGAGTSASVLAGVLTPWASEFGHSDGQAYLLALLAGAGRDPVPGLEATLRELPEMIAKSLTPHLQQTMSNVIEKAIRHSDLAYLALDPALTSKMLERVALRSEAIEEALLKSLLAGEGSGE